MDRWSGLAVGARVSYDGPTVHQPSARACAPFTGCSMKSSLHANTASSRRPPALGRKLGLALVAALTAGCTATKSTVYFAKAEQSLYQARVLDAETWAPYMWTRANETMKKSREEWAYADFGAAEQLAIEAAELAERAAERAQENKAKGVVPGQLRELPKAPTAAPAPAAPETNAVQSPPSETTTAPWNG